MVSSPRGIAVNLKFPQNMVVVSQQDRCVHPLAVSIDYSIDGGRTWNHSNPILSRCQGPTLNGALNDFEFVRSPRVVSDLNGNFYVMILAFNIISNKDEAILLIKSTDGGRSWTEPLAITKDNGQDHFHTDASIYTDPANAERLFVLWTDLQGKVSNLPPLMEEPGVLLSSSETSSPGIFLKQAWPSYRTVY